MKKIHIRGIIRKMWIYNIKDDIQIKRLIFLSVSREKLAFLTQLNPSRTLIKGVICGVRVEDIEKPTMQAIRYLDKLV